MITRRRFVKLLSSLPLVGAWQSALSQQPPPPPSPTQKEEWESQFSAVKLLRLINTAEHWERGAGRQFQGKTELIASLSYTDLVQRPTENNPYRSIVGMLTPDKAQILPRWRLSLTASNDRKAYTALAVRDDGFAFGTNEEAIIYEGRALSASASHAPLNEVLADMRFAGTKRRAKPSGVSSLIATFLASNLIAFFSGVATNTASVVTAVSHAIATVLVKVAMNVMEPAAARIAVAVFAYGAAA